MRNKIESAVQINIFIFLYKFVHFSCLHQQVSASAMPVTEVSNGSPEPDYSAPIHNVTVALGREAKLSCIVNNLGEYKVGWMKADTQTILSLQNKVVTHNTRISVSHEEPRTWNLHIRQIQEDDRGCYMCQINTSSMKKTTGCIDVHVPPDIVDTQSSSDVKVTEGGDVSLKCVAKGYPEPTIKWKRENGEKIILRKGRKDKEKKKVEEVNGPFLNLTKVNKRYMGAYHCIASNGVPPAVVKRIEVNVHFAPTIEVRTQLVGAPLGSDMILRCLVEASPRPITFWQRKDTRDILMDSSKYNVTEEHDSYKVSMTLVVGRLSPADYGAYLCNARNSLGMAEEQIRTYKIEMETQKPNTNPKGGDSRVVSPRGGNLQVPSVDVELDSLVKGHKPLPVDHSSSASSGSPDDTKDKNYISPSSDKEHSSYAEGHHRDMNFMRIPPALDGMKSSAQLTSGSINHFLSLIISVLLFFNW